LQKAEKSFLLNPLRWLNPSVFSPAQVRDRKEHLWSKTKSARCDDAHLTSLMQS
jgi:hypothetical protein